MFEIEIESSEKNHRPLADITLTKAYSSPTPSIVKLKFEGNPAWRYLLLEKYGFYENMCSVVAYNRSL
jgi:hypothetical protein